MFSQRGGGILSLVLILVSIDRFSPIRGQARRLRGPSHSFVGWLGLLRALSALMEDGSRYP